MHPGEDLIAIPPGVADEDVRCHARSFTSLLNSSQARPGFPLAKGAFAAHNRASAPPRAGRRSTMQQPWASEVKKGRWKAKQRGSQLRALLRPASAVLTLRESVWAFPGFEARQCRSITMP